MATVDHLVNRNLDISNEMELALQSDLQSWFPRVNDPRGGFIEDLDRKWRPTGDRARHLIHQARLTWTAAAYAGHDATVRSAFATYALHGIEFMDRVLRDPEHGGLYYEVTLDGHPLRNGDKHACAMAFAIFGAARTYSVTRDGRALDVARECFAWLDRHSHREGQGYVEDLTRDGSPIIDRPRRNPLGFYYGEVTANTHLHLLEAFAELYRVDPDPAVRERLESAFVMMRDRFVTRNGRLLYRLGDDTLFASHGHAVEDAYLLTDAAEALGMPDDPATWEVATHLADRALTLGRDSRHGGLLNEPGKDRGVKISWVQAEALTTWFRMDRHETAVGSTTSRWRDAIDEQWRFIGDHLIDRKHGGWFWQTTRRGWRSGLAAKSSEWRDPYHTTRALIHGSKWIESNIR